MALPAGMSACALCVEICTDGGGTTWDDVSDTMTVVEQPEPSRMVSDTYVFSEDVALITAGKKEPVDVIGRFLYTEGTGTTDVWYRSYTQFDTDCGGEFAIRWAPKGCSTAYQVVSTPTSGNEISTLQFPGGDAGSSDAILCQVTVHVNRLTWATYA